MRLKLAATLPDIYFTCTTYSADLKKTACVSRQTAGGTTNWATRTKQGIKRISRRFIPPFLYFCGSGRCVQGAAIRASMPEQTPVMLRPRGIGGGG